jgi:hypothetical protein
VALYVLDWTSTSAFIGGRFVFCYEACSLFYELRCPGQVDIWNTSLNHLLASSLVPRLRSEGEGLSDFEASPSGRRTLIL